MSDHEAAQHARILALEASVNRLSSGDVLAACMRERDQLAETCRSLRLEVAGQAEHIEELARSVGEWRSAAHHVDGFRSANETLRARVTELETRQQELLATIVRLTNEVPFAEEVTGWIDQRAKMVAEIGTYRAKAAEEMRRANAAVKRAQLAETEVESLLRQMASK